GAVEVVHHQKPTAQQIFAEPRSFLIVEMPAPDLDGIEPRIIEQIVVAQAHHARLADLDARQAGYGTPEVDLGLGIVHEPAPSETIAEIGVLKAREAKFRCGSAARRIAACGHREGRYRNRAEPS